MPTCLNCGVSFPNRIVIDGMDRVINTRKYCLICSPYKCRNTVRIHLKKVPKCSICGEENPSRFYGKKFTRCGKCHNDYTMAKAREKRLYATTKLGGKCAVCGFNYFNEALAIHHLDPSLKDDNFKNMSGWCFSRIDKEIEHCILLCMNCHTGYHTGHIILPDYTNISEGFNGCGGSNPLTPTNLH